MTHFSITDLIKPPIFFPPPSVPLPRHHFRPRMSHLFSGGGGGGGAPASASPLDESVLYTIPASERRLHNAKKTLYSVLFTLEALEGGFLSSSITAADYEAQFKPLFVAVDSTVKEIGAMTGNKAYRLADFVAEFGLERTCVKAYQRIVDNHGVGATSIAPPDQVGPDPIQVADTTGRYQTILDALGYGFVSGCLALGDAWRGGGPAADARFAEYVSSAHKAANWRAFVLRRQCVGRSEGFGRIRGGIATK
jgi:hypothetical protein